MLSVIHRPDKIRAQQFGQLPGIDAVTLAALFQQRIPAGITQHEFRDVRLQQIVQTSQLPSSNLPGFLFLLPKKK